MTKTMARKPKTFAPVRPNQGIRAEYQRRLDRLVDGMAKSAAYWIPAAYRATPPVAMDASPAVELNAAVKDWARRWQRKFDALAPELARWFAQDVNRRSDAALRASLRKAGFTVEFRMSAAQQDVVSATVAENVALIRSIPEKYAASVQGAVMRSVQAGRDIGALTRDLQAAHGVSTRRAALIARDQNNKATAMLQRARHRELGITKAIWVHSGGAKEPRPEHVAASGKTYDVEKGMFLEGKWTWPGFEINCGCIARPVVPGFT